METIQSTQFDDHPCTEVKMITQSGYLTRVFFDRQSGMVAGNIATQESLFGTVTATTIMRDYRDFEGLKIPVKTIIRVGSLDQVLTIESVVFDQVKDGVFEVPPTIRALLPPPEPEKTDPSESPEKVTGKTPVK